VARQASWDDSIAVWDSTLYSWDGEFLGAYADAPGCDRLVVQYSRPHATLTTGTQTIVATNATPMIIAKV